MSEINVEYARLCKTFSASVHSNHEVLTKNLEKIQSDIARILKEIPDETKNEIRNKAEQFLRAQWQKKLQPLLPHPFQKIANTLIKEKITGFNPERELNNLDVGKLVSGITSRKE